MREARPYPGRDVLQFAAVFGWVWFYAFLLRQVLASQIDDYHALPRYWAFSI